MGEGKPEPKGAGGADRAGAGGANRPPRAEAAGAPRDGWGRPPRAHARGGARAAPTEGDRRRRHTPGEGEACGLDRLVGVGLDELLEERAVVAHRLAAGLG